VGDALAPRKSLTAAFPTPSFPCRVSPGRKDTAIATSSGPAARRHAAIASRFASRFPVSAARREASTSVANRVIG
jgi:hypothetical protein